MYNICLLITRGEFLKKAQAAMEFILTYGWVLVSVLTIIGLLYYFGVMNPVIYVAEQCIASYPFNCLGKPFVNNSELNIMLANRGDYILFFDTNDIQLPVGCSAASLCIDSECLSSRTITVNMKTLLKINCTMDNKQILRYKFKAYVTNLASGLKEELNFYIVAKVKN
ncbi:MAG: hypothetical protein KatS3mg002_1100 [Candidatus Woesearchaeota archaeon]|nr:MAG: hypothetical protein KatS3mg002_1100 [Candidatus Woesearchaeota archaeon]